MFSQMPMKAGAAAAQIAQSQSPFARGFEMPGGFDNNMVHGGHHLISRQRRIHDINVAKGQNSLYGFTGTFQNEKKKNSEIGNVVAVPVRANKSAYIQYVQR